MTESIGQRLKSAREHRRLTIEQAAESTRIRAKFLQALEADDFSALPSPVQARGFLRNYAQFLGLDLDEIVNELRATQPEQNEVLFEGEQAPSTQEEANPPEPEAEAERSQAETSLDSLWRTWLHRTKQELQETDEESASQPDEKPTSVLEAESAPEVEANPGVETEAAKSETEDEVQPEAPVPTRARNKARISQKKTETATEPADELEAPAESAESSQAILNEIGQQLFQRREMLSLTLDEIERHTRMRAQFMEALEKGNFDELPSPVQARGMLANYAGFLDLDVDALLLRFADALQARRLERHPSKTAPRSQTVIPENLPTLRTFIAGDMLFGVGMVLLLVIFSVWGISRVLALQAQRQAALEVNVTQPSISEALIGTPVETVVSEATLVPVADTPLPTLSEGSLEAPTLVANVNVVVNVVALERAYMRVTVDGEVVFEGRTIPGNAYQYEAEQSIELLTGSGAALRVVYNQRDLGLLGGFGQVAHFIYTPDEIIVPTPEVPPTATNTPYLSPTPSVTPTPTVTPTSTSTVTPTRATP